MAFLCLRFAPFFDAERSAEPAIAERSNRLPLRAVFLAFHGCRRRRE